MSYDPYQSSSTPPYSAADTSIDAGLQNYMRGVYNTMGLGLGVTGFVAFMVANTPALFNAIFHTPLVWVALFAPMIFLWMGFTPGRIARMNSAKLRLNFYIFAGIMGLSFASLFQIFTGASIARAFFITSAMFAGTSLYGYTTRRDLTGIASFLIMGMMGIFFAALINIFLHSSMTHFIISIISVVVFTGLTAFETQRLKETYRSGLAYNETNAKVALMGALNLYMSFINLFQVILQFTGSRDR